MKQHTLNITVDYNFSSDPLHFKTPTVETTWNNLPRKIEIISENFERIMEGAFKDEALKKAMSEAKVEGHLNDEHELTVTVILDRKELAHVTVDNVKFKELPLAQAELSLEIANWIRNPQHYKEDNNDG